jgi:hypothetical protein
MPYSLRGEAGQGFDPATHLALPAGEVAGRRAKAGNPGRFLGLCTGQRLHGLASLSKRLLVEDGQTYPTSNSNHCSTVLTTRREPVSVDPNSGHDMSPRGLMLSPVGFHIRLSIAGHAATPRPTLEAAVVSPRAGVELIPESLILRDS